MTTELTTNDKESRLAVILQGLNERELSAYKYFIRAKQPSVSEDTAEQMYNLYRRGVSCEEIRRLFTAFGLGQIVACRVAFEWDGRLKSERENQRKDVPAKIDSTQLDLQVFLSTLLAASGKRFMDNMNMYIATGEAKYLEGIPTPKNARELATLVETYMKVAGLDAKRVDVTVHQQPAQAAVMKQEDAEAAVDQLLKDQGNVVDASFEPAPPVAALPPVPAPVSREQVLKNFMAGGASQEEAEAMLASLDKDINKLASKYVEKVLTGNVGDDISVKKDDEVN